MWLGGLPHLILKAQMAVAGAHTGVCLGINTSGTSTVPVIAGSVWLGGLGGEKFAAHGAGPLLCIPCARVLQQVIGGYTDCR